MAASFYSAPRRVFLSHTAELRQYPMPRSFVDAAEEAVARAGDAVVDMAYFAARDDEPAAACRAAVSSADVVVVIAGFCYGSTVRDAPDQSYVEFEYAAAAAASLPRLVFLLDDAAEGPRALMHDGRFGDRQDAFRAELRASQIIATFTSPDDLVAKLLHALTELSAQQTRLAEARRSTASSPTLTFLCHSSGDKPAVRRLHQRLTSDGVRCWLDERNLLPGQDWNHEIREAIRSATHVVACLSQNSVERAGYVNKELRFALDRADEQTESSIFLIPVRLEPCTVPDRLAHLQYVDLFTKNGYDRLLDALKYIPGDA